MEQTSKSVKAHVVILKRALGTLSEALLAPFNDLVRDAVIQRFEYVFELSWKTIQVAAKYMGVSCNSPREAIKTAFKLNWISNVDIWYEALEARNETSHTYNQAIAEEVYKTAKAFVPLVEKLVTSLEVNSSLPE